MHNIFILIYNLTVIIIFSWVHLIFNLTVQLLVGLPLEMVHGSLRIGVVYMAGVLAGIYIFNLKSFSYIMFFIHVIKPLYKNDWDKCNLTLYHHRYRVLGSLATSVFDSNVYLVGASGGVYALLAAHLANVLLVRIFDYYISLKA